MSRDLEKVHARVGPFEFLFVTGDLTLHGTAEEFAEVDRVLESLYEVFASLGSEPRLVAVPGERDVLAATDLYEAEWVALRTWHADPGLRGHVLALDVDLRQLHAVCGGDALAWLGQHPMNLLLTCHAATQQEDRGARRVPRGDHSAGAVRGPPGRAWRRRGEPDATGGASRLVVPGVPLFDGQAMMRDGRSFGYDAMRIEVDARVVRVRHFPRRMFGGATDLRFGAAVEGDEGDGAEVFEVPRMRRGW